MVYVLSQDGKPLMPTERHGKVRRMLNSGRAKVVRVKPFTIQLLYQTTDYVQPVTLGIDSGYASIGFSGVTDQKELFSGEAKLLTGQVERNRERARYRRQRRSRLRYRAPRFNNRRTPEGWLAPSIQHKLDSHLRLVDLIKGLLPIAKIIIEVASFDIQKIKNPEISGIEYQEGEQLGFWNLREYILHRDNHQCQNPNCKNKSINPILEVHHIGFWEADRTDKPGNLITLCDKCHVPANHLSGGSLYGWEPKVQSFKSETFMSIVRWRLVNLFGCQHTYGYITKSNRIEVGLDKTHANDAFCISGRAGQTRCLPLQIEQVRRNNRSLEKFYDARYVDARTGKTASGQELFSGRRTRNTSLNSDNLRQHRGHKTSKGKRAIRIDHYPIQPKDVLVYKGQKYTSKGVHCKGSRVILQENNKSVKVTEVQIYKYGKGFRIA